jgi:hypothetical protein
VVDSCRLLDYRNGKKFWTQLQTLTGQKTTTVHHLVRNNAIINTPLEKANCYAETLEQIHQVPNDPHFNDAFFAQVIRSVNNFRRNPPNHPLRLLPEDDSLVVEVLPDEVEAHIRQLKSKKAPGPDELKAPIFKNLPRIAIVALTVIFNNCMRAHHFPPAWKHATTVMIPKPGKDPTNPLSYRPISLLNIAGKVFEKILSKHLENQAKPAQIPVHLNVLLRSQVPPPSPPSPTQQPGHPQTSTHPLPRRHLFQKLYPQPGRQGNLQKIPQPSQPPVQDSRAHPWVRFENPVPHLQILHPSRHRIPRPHLRHPIPGPPPPNLRLREKNAPQDLSTPRQVPLRQPPPGNQHNPDPIPPQRTPEPLRDTHPKLQQRPRHPNPVHLV